MISGGFGNPFVSYYDHYGTNIVTGGEDAMVFSNNFFIRRFGIVTSGMSNAKTEIQGFKNYHIEKEYGGLEIGYS